MTQRIGQLLLLLGATACVQPTEETEAVRKDYIKDASANFYHEAFVATVPTAYWRICELVVRDGFEFEKIIGVSGLDIVDGGIVDSHRTVSLTYQGKVALHVQQPIGIRNACYLNGWTNDIDAAPAMISEAISAINCSTFDEIEPNPDFLAMGGRSFVCGDKILHTAVRELKPDEIAVGIAVEQRG